MKVSLIPFVVTSTDLTQCLSGDVDPLVVKDIFEHYVDAGADILMLADTLGVGTAEQVKVLVETVKPTMTGSQEIGLHMHDGHGLASENIRTGAEIGIRR